MQRSDLGEKMVCFCGICYSKKTAETIAIQMLPFEDCREREILTFDGDVELIIKEGEVYYLPNEKSSK